MNAKVGRERPNASQCQKASSMGMTQKAPLLQDGHGAADLQRLFSLLSPHCAVVLRTLLLKTGVTLNANSPCTLPLSAPDAMSFCCAVLACNAELVPSFVVLINILYISNKLILNKFYSH